VHGAQLAKPTNQHARITNTPRHKPIQTKTKKGEPTVPSLLGEELDTNPFLRPFDPEIREKAGAPAGAGDAAAFGAVRAAKDSFRG
jgi:hydroxyacylglutathione hydrolase